jgi:CRISPR-associated protein Cas1
MASIRCSPSIAKGLTCDLVEPARPLVDRFVHSLFADTVLRPEDFSGRDDAGCMMGKSGRRAYYAAFEERCATQLRETIDRTARELLTRLLDRFVAQPTARLLPAPADHPTGVANDELPF